MLRWLRLLWPLVGVFLSLAVGLGLSRLGTAERIEEGLNARVLQTSAERPKRFPKIVVVDLGQEFIPEGGYAWSSGAARAKHCGELAKELHPLLDRVGSVRKTGQWSSQCPAIATKLKGLSTKVVNVVDTREKMCGALAVAIERLFRWGAKVVVIDLLLGPKPKSMVDDETPTEGRTTNCGQLTTESPLFKVIEKHQSKIVVPAFLELPVNAPLDKAESVLLPAKPLAALPRLNLGLVNMYFSEGVVGRMPACTRGPDRRTYCGLGVVGAQLMVGAKRPRVSHDTLRFGARRFHLMDGTLSYSLHRFGEFVTLTKLTESEQAQKKHPGDVRELKRRIAGSLVFIGPRNPSKTRFGEKVDGDLHSTPFRGKARFLSGVEIHANVAATLLSGEGLAPVSRGWWWLGAMLLVLVAFAIGRYLGLKYSPLVGLLFLGLCGFGVVLARRYLWVFIPLIGVLSSGGVAFLFGVGVRWTTVSRKRLKLWLSLRHQLSRSGMEEVMRDPATVEQAVELEEVTVLFSDIRGFSALSEKLRPAEIVVLLKDWLTEATLCLIEERGYLENYLGDGFMGIFGAPLRVESSEAQVTNACRSALAMTRRLAELNVTWKKEGRPELDIGIGLNTGMALAGDMGTRMRFHYTAVGDCVNLGSRIEGLNKMYGTTILVGQRTWELGRDNFPFREIDLVRVKGRTEPEAIYQLLGELGEVDDIDFGPFERGLSAYRQCDFTAAREAFEAFMADHPADGPSRTFLERIEELEQDPPAPGWDGVFTAKTK